jgi:uncharacterized protein involved in exopolysaccharide biosynthesis
LSDIHLPTQNDSENDPDDSDGQPEVRLELTRAGVQQVLSLYSQEQESTRSEFEFSLRLEDFQEAFRERRQMLAIGLAGGLALGLMVLLFSTPLYPVTAQVVLERHDLSTNSVGGGVGSGGSAFIATQAEMLHSQSVIEAAVASIPRPAHLEPDDDAAADAKESVQASAVSGTHVVALGYLGPDGTYGVQLLNAIVAAYRSVLRSNEQQSQEHKLLAKQAEIEVLATEADVVEARIEALRVEHKMLGSSEEALAAQSAILRDYAEQITDVRSQRIAFENRLATGGKRLAILDPAMRSLQERLWQAEAELAQVRLSLRAIHPAVEAKQQEVDVLREQLSSTSESTPEALERDIEASLGLEAQLEGVYQRERLRMADLERYRRAEEDLELELTQIREMRDDKRGELLDQRLVTRLAESGEVGVTARMIEAPAVPESAAWPKPKLVLSGSAILGVLGGMTAALISLRSGRRGRSGRREWVSGPTPAGEEAVLP